MSEDDDWEALSRGHPLTWLFPFRKSLTGIEIAWLTGLLDGRPSSATRLTTHNMRATLSYSVIRVSGPGVYGECADR